MSGGLRSSACRTLLAGLGQAAERVVVGVAGGPRARVADEGGRAVGRGGVRLDRARRVGGARGGEGFHPQLLAVQAQLLHRRDLRFWDDGSGSILAGYAERAPEFH